VVWPLKFLRACVSAKDDFYNRFIVTKNIMAPVMAVFLLHVNSTNLINSAVLELTASIVWPGGKQTEKEKERQPALGLTVASRPPLLLTHVCETYGVLLRAVHYADDIFDYILGRAQKSAATM
jgi:hypothetical protein